MDRRKIITKLIDCSGLGLEIGPSHDPVMRKSCGHRVHILDHLTQDELKAKYRDHGVNLDNIEPVDFVSDGRPLDEIIGGRAKYDWIIASHVIEHVPDLVRFIRDCQTILKPRGILSLAVPDHRYCFDHFRPLSSTGEVIQAYLEERKRHTPGQVYDSFSMASKLGGAIAWSPDRQGAPELLHPQEFSKHMLEQAMSSQGYIDIHAWVFTPHSFQLLIYDLNYLGLIDAHLEYFHGTSGCEFFAAFRNEPWPRDGDRQALVRLAHEESVVWRQDTT